MTETLSLSDPKIETDILNRILRLRDRYRQAFNVEPAQTYADAELRAATIANNLRDPETGFACGFGIRETLVDVGELGTVEFWQTPLGRALLYQTGGYSAGLTRRAALAAALGVSRQRVHVLVQEGRLYLDIAGLDLDYQSVREYLRDRWPNA
jgi:hypothetical protein